MNTDYERACNAFRKMEKNGEIHCTFQSSVNKNNVPRLYLITIEEGPAASQAILARYFSILCGVHTFVFNEDGSFLRSISGRVTV